MNRYLAVSIFCFAIAAILIGVLIVVNADEPYPVGVVPVGTRVHAPQIQANFMLNGSFEWEPHDTAWSFDPEGHNQIYYDPDRAREGDWLLSHSSWDYFGPQYAWQCWGKGTLDGYINHTLYESHKCSGNDVFQLNYSTMHLLGYDPDTEQWWQLTDEFGDMQGNKCGLGQWDSMGWWFVGLEEFTDDYDICLEIVTTFDSIYNCRYDRDAFEWRAHRVDHQTYLPLIWNRPAKNHPPN